MKIKTRLIILFLLVSLLPLALASAVFYITARSLVSGQIERRLDLHANFVESWIEATVDDHSSRLQSISEVPQLRDGLVEYGTSGRTNARAMLTKLLRFSQLSVPGLNRLVLYDSNGTFVTSSVGPEDQFSPRRFPYVEKLSRVSARARFATFVRQDDQRYALHIAVPIKNEKGPGFLLVESDLTSVKGLARRSIELGSSAREEVILATRGVGGNSPGVALAFNSAGEKPVPWANDGTSRELPVEAALDGQEVTFSDVDDQSGRSVFAVTRYIPALDAGLVLKVSRSEAFSPLGTVSFIVLALSAALLAAVVLLARLLSGTLNAPLGGLMSAVRKLEAGDLDAQLPPQDIDEFRELEHAFNRMTLQLKQSKETVLEEVERVKDQEQRTRAIVESSLDAVVGMDELGKVSEWNPAAEQLWGYPREEALGRSIADLLVPASEADRRNIDFRSFCLQRSPRLIGKRMELAAVTKTGVRVPIELVVTESKVGEDLTYTCFVRDLSDEKQAQLQSLWYGSILRNSHDGIIGTDLASRIILWNAAAERIFGFTTGEALGQPIDIIVPPDLLPEERSAFDQLVRGEDVEAIETVRRRKSGELVDVSLSISPIIGSDGRFVGAAKVVRDISKRRAEEKRFQLVVEAAPAAMIMFGESGDVQLVNAHAEKLFGYRREEMLGKSVDLFLPRQVNGNGADPKDSLLTRSLQAVKAKDASARRKDGTTFTAEVGLNPVVTESGTLVLGSIVDVTERKQTEQFIRNSLREKEVLLKEIHHRVKNNLQVISSLLRLQGEYLPDEHSRGLFKQCDDRVRSMALIHERLYRSEGFSDIDLSEYIRELASSLVRSYAVRVPKVTLNFDLQPVHLGIDKAIPCGLLLNEFISNALKHAFEPDQAGVLTLRLSEHENDVKLVVADNGRGLPPDWEIKKASTLGFQIVRTLIEQVDGKLEIEQGNGTTFTLVFERDPLQAEKRSDGSSEHLGV